MSRLKHPHVVNRLFVLLQWLIALIIKRRAVRVLYTDTPHA